MLLKTMEVHDDLSNIFFTADCSVHHNGRTDIRAGKGRSNNGYKSEIGRFRKDF